MWNTCHDNGGGVALNSRHIKIQPPEEAVFVPT